MEAADNPAGSVGSETGDASMPANGVGRPFVGASSSPAPTPQQGDEDSPSPLPEQGDVSQEADEAEIAEQELRIKNGADDAEQHAEFVKTTMAQSTTVVVVEDGSLKWEVVEGDGKRAWIEADVTTSAGCGFGPSSTARIRVALHSELPQLQPSVSQSLLFIGDRLDEKTDSTIVAHLALRWDGDHVQLHFPEKTIPLSDADIRTACEEKLQ